MAKSKDLFDDTTMSFGEHLEVLRRHLWKAIIGLVVCVIAALFFGNYVVALVRSPIDAALQQHGIEAPEDVGSFDLWKNLKSLFSDEEAKQEEEPESGTSEESEEPPTDGKTITIEFRLADLVEELHKSDPEGYPPPQKDAEKRISLRISSTHFGELEQIKARQNRPITLNVQEAFLTYLKVAFVTGFVIASPWVFYQMWLFVAAGLYPHERRYVHIYLPMSLALFIGGAVFCFFLVFPFVLKFLLGFNEWLNLTPQIRMSEWISFALMLPVMFGLSFQLPLVMLFLERISIFDAADYRAKRRMAVLVIAVISMLLTPADPMSMLMMMLPLIGLYELGIWMCSFSPAQSPFQEAEAL